MKDRGKERKLQRKRLPYPHPAPSLAGVSLSTKTKTRYERAASETIRQVPHSQRLRAAFSWPPTPRPEPVCQASYSNDSLQVAIMQVTFRGHFPSHIHRLVQCSPSGVEVVPSRTTCLKTKLGADSWAQPRHTE